MSKKKANNSLEIKDVLATDDNLSSRGGLALFNKYISSIGILTILGDRFFNLRKSKKGISVINLFNQIFCFFMDGTSSHLTYFDNLKKDKGYASTIETSESNMASSHSMKRFFRLFSWTHGRVFRKVLRQLFIWRLKLKKPSTIELTIDTMIMDNNESLKKHGCKPTYKKVLGFQPLHLIWEGKIIDSVFRGGNKHSNHGDTAIKMIEESVKLIRQKYNSKVTIIFRLDSGFYDEKIFKKCDELGVAFVCSGKMGKDIKKLVSDQPESDWEEYKNKTQVWNYLDFRFKCICWEQDYRTLYTRPVYDEYGQGVIDFARPDNVIITNIGDNKSVLENCSDEDRKKFLDSKFIIYSNHQRGKDELPHRGLKDFGFEELPFKKFPANNAFYYCMLIAFFLFETFKEDVTSDVVPITSYATTLRRKVIDIAARLVQTGRNVLLKIPRSIMVDVNFKNLWNLSLNPPRIQYE